MKRRVLNNRTDNETTRENSELNDKNAGPGSKTEFNNNTELNNKKVVAEKEVTTENIRNILSDSADVKYQVYYAGGSNLPVTAVFVDGLVDTKLIDEYVLKPLMKDKALEEVKSVAEIIELIGRGVIFHASRKIRSDLETTLEDILDGSVALIFDDEKKAVTFDTKGYPKRAITEPTTESAMKGAKDSFIEVLRVNTSLIRRKIRTPYLRIKEVIVGKQTRTSVAIIYIENIANPNLVREVTDRLSKIDIDGATTAGSIEENIIDNKRTLFPLVINTERTDKFCHNILEGRVGLLIDGLPTAYIIPATIDMFFQTPEDYAQNYIISSFLRCLRYINSLITLLLPGFYIAVTTFHQEMIPTVLAITIIRSKSEVPFPTSTSIFFMLLAFEVLIEAGFRLPKTIGQTISIVGALVVGQAAVQAKIISPVVVIIIAMAGMAGLTMPNQDFLNALRICRMVFAICATIAGLYGLSLGFLLLIYHLNTLETFGVPYFTPFVASDGRDILRDSIIRMPLRFMKKRPSSLKTLNKKRQR